MSVRAAICAGFLGAAAPASADVLKVSTEQDFRKVSTEQEFRDIISGKTLTRPMIRLQVSPSGTISGRGLRWDVDGNWTWQNGFFCRDLAWGGDSLGYNCQEVRVNGQKIRFTSDRGAGDFADFKLK